MLFNRIEVIDIKINNKRGILNELETDCANELTAKEEYKSYKYEYETESWEKTKAHYNHELKNNIVIRRTFKMDKQNKL